MSQALFIDLSVEQQEIVAGGGDSLFAFNTSNYFAKNTLNIYDKTLTVAGTSGPGGSAGVTALAVKQVKASSVIDTSQVTKIIVK
ncbi:hypothetical protein BZZ01_22550 [Nostocales cyanobacterium HT-58-2]|nr:hypothetical protein BZZ01_22550 [Nostocales cyanobacterium HT-58-2]